DAEAPRALARRVPHRAARPARVRRPALPAVHTAEGEPMPPRARRPPPDPRTIHDAPPKPPDDAELRRRLLEHIGTLGLIDLSETELDEHLAWALQRGPSHTQIVERVLGQASARKCHGCCARRIRDHRLPARYTLGSPTY